MVDKPTLKTGFRPILQKKLGSKEFKLIYDVGGGKNGSRQHQGFPGGRGGYGDEQPCRQKHCCHGEAMFFHEQGHCTK
jgi:hypothetical protein